jgi:hypothetical protein
MSKTFLAVLATAFASVSFNAAAATPVPAGADKAAAVAAASGKKATKAPKKAKKAKKAAAK